MGLDSPEPAPDGCLCDAATVDGAYYKQGDGNVPIHDWALEETLSAVVMQAEQLLQERKLDDIEYFLPLFNRTMNLILSRQHPGNNMFLFGDASNLLAPSYGAWLQPDGTRKPAYLTGAGVTYVAAIDRVIELKLLVGDRIGARNDDTSRFVVLRALALDFLDRDYFVRWMDPDGTLHGVLGQAQHGYIDAVVNHDAVAFGVADRISPGLGDAIMARMLGNTIPSPGLRPYTFVITNAGRCVQIPVCLVLCPSMLCLSCRSTVNSATVKLIVLSRTGCCAVAGEHHSGQRLLFFAFAL